MTESVRLVDHRITELIKNTVRNYRIDYSVSGALQRDRVLGLCGGMVGAITYTKGSNESVMISIDELKVEDPAALGDEESKYNVAMNTLFNVAEAQVQGRLKHLQESRANKDAVTVPPKHEKDSIEESVHAALNKLLESFVTMIGPTAPTQYDMRCGFFEGFLKAFEIINEYMNEEYPMAVRVAVPLIIEAAAKEAYAKEVQRGF